MPAPGLAPCLAPVVYDHDLAPAFGRRLPVEPGSWPFLPNYNLPKWTDWIAARAKELFKEREQDAWRCHLNLDMVRENCRDEAGKEWSARLDVQLDDHYHELFNERSHMTGQQRIKENFHWGNATSAEREAFDQRCRLRRLSDSWYLAKIETIRALEAKMAAL